MIFFVILKIVLLYVHPFLGKGVKMYNKIIVPLDGSKLAESVFPHVENIVRGCAHSHVYFVSVVRATQVTTIDEPTRIAPEDSIERARIIAETDSTDFMNKYLNEVISRLKLPHCHVLAKVLTGKVPDTLVEFAANNNIDLIIMSSHGRSGISRLFWGNAADSILRSSCVPVMLIRAPGCGMEFKEQVT